MQTGLPGMRSRELLLFNVACESATLRMIALPGGFRTQRPLSGAFWTVRSLWGDISPFQTSKMERCRSTIHRVSERRPTTWTRCPRRDCCSPNALDNASASGEAGPPGPPRPGGALHTCRTRSLAYEADACYSYEQSIFGGLRAYVRIRRYIPTSKYLGR